MPGWNHSKYRFLSILPLFFSFSLQLALSFFVCKNFSRENPGWLQEKGGRGVTKKICVIQERWRGSFPFQFSSSFQLSFPLNFLLAFSFLFFSLLFPFSLYFHPCLSSCIHPESWVVKYVYFFLSQFLITFHSFLFWWA